VPYAAEQDLEDVFAFFLKLMVVLWVMNIQTNPLQVVSVSKYWDQTFTIKAPFFSSKDCEEEKFEKGKLK
jgi:hypothetical protein